MCSLRNIAMRDYHESMTIEQTHRRTHRQMPDKVILMCCYASKATQKVIDKRTKIKSKCCQGREFNLCPLITSVFPELKVILP